MPMTVQQFLVGQQTAPLLQPLYSPDFAHCDFGCALDQNGALRLTFCYSCWQNAMWQLACVPYQRWLYTSVRVWVVCDCTCVCVCVYVVCVHMCVQAHTCMHVCVWVWVVCVCVHARTCMCVCVCHKSNNTSFTVQNSNENRRFLTICKHLELKSSEEVENIFSFIKLF
jgi:hypothetical protein